MIAILAILLLAAAVCMADNRQGAFVVIWLVMLVLSGIAAVAGIN